MIKLKTLLAEIALAKHTPFDNYLGQAIVQVFGTPPKYTGDQTDKKAFGDYLEGLEVWAKQHIPEHGVLLDIPHKKLYKADAKTESMQGIFHFDDEYESFEDFLDDHFEAPELVLIHSSQLARYVFGEDIATRIVIPGRNNS
jgi:hypothetical protein